MDLQDFVSETLLQIVNGVKDAQAKASEGAIISPKVNCGTDVGAQLGYLWSGSMREGTFAQIVQFDVALTVTDSTEHKAGIGVFGGAVSLGASGKSAEGNNSVSRVKFSVPLVLP